MLGVEHWQVLDPILLLLSHVVMYVSARWQGDYILLDQARGSWFPINFWYTHRFFKGVLVLDVAVDQFCNDALVIY